MSHLKSEFTCNICQFILKDPVELPCTHSICSEHVRDFTAKNGRTECLNCAIDFDVPQNGFSPNLEAINYIVEENHLTEEAKSIKQATHDLIQQLEQLQADVHMKHKIMQATCFEHFYRNLQPNRHTMRKTKLIMLKRK